MAPDHVNQENVVWYVQDHRRRLEHIEARTEDLGVLRREVADLKAEFAELKAEMVNQRRALYTFAFSVAGGAVLFAITVLQVIK